MELIQNNLFTKEQIQQIRQEWAEIVKPLKEFMTVDEIADYLGLSKSAIYKLTSKRELPFYNPGGKKIYFKREEIDAWVEASRVSSDSEVLEEFNNIGYNSNAPELW